MQLKKISRFLVPAAVLLGSTLFAAATEIPAGTHVNVRINQTLSSGSAKTGQTWSGTLSGDISVDGKVVAKNGDAVKGKVTYAKSSGRLSDPGQLSLRLSSINGQAVTSSRVSRKGSSHTKSNVAKIGGSTAGGALIGGLIGGGKGAAIGAGAGAAGGTGVAAATGKKEAVISSETVLTFTITGSK
jgi:hypothetical protein